MLEFPCQGLIKAKGIPLNVYYRFIFNTEQVHLYYICITFSVFFFRCGRLGEQSEAIVRFPALFAKYPFPILINSGLLTNQIISISCLNFHA